jgi:hypothetical protein
MFFSALALLGLAGLLVGLFWRAWIVWQHDDAVGLTLTTLVAMCVPFAGLLLQREQDPRERRALAVIVGGLGLLLLSSYVAQQLRREGAAAMQWATRSAASASVAVTSPAPLAVSDPTGATLDLSTLMGRAQVRANAWQSEAALLGIEVTHLTRRGVETEAGGKAKFRYGPSPYRPATAGGTLVVTYDRGGLSGVNSQEKPADALPEPMCSPEEVYRLTVGEGETKPISLVYKIDVNGQAAWHASDPSTPDLKPKVYDRQNCMPRANTKTPRR